MGWLMLVCYFITLSHNSAMLYNGATFQHPTGCNFNVKHIRLLLLLLFCSKWKITGNNLTYFITYSYHLCVYMMYFNNGSFYLLPKRFSSAGNMMWYDNPMILPFGYTVCLKTRSALSGIFGFFNHNCSVVTRHAGRIQRGQLLINACGMMEMTCTCQYTQSHWVQKKTKKSKYGTNRDIDNSPCFIH